MWSSFIQTFLSVKIESPQVLMKTIIVAIIALIVIVAMIVLLTIANRMPFLAIPREKK